MGSMYHIVSFLCVFSRIQLLCVESILFSISVLVFDAVILLQCCMLFFFKVLQDFVWVVA